MPSTLIRGIDLSHWQGQVHFPSLKDAACGYALLKVSEGTKADPNFEAYRAGCRQIALQPGYYHYLDPNVDAQAQAEAFCAILGAWLPTDLAPALDLEACGNLGRGEIEYRATIWLQEVAEQFKCTPMLYTYPSFVTEHLPTDHKLGVYPLWIADPNHKDAPILPNGWTDWKIWQYGQDRVDGIIGVVDVNYMKVA